MNHQEFNELIQGVIDNFDHNKCARYCMKNKEVTHISNFFYMNIDKNPFNKRFDCLDCEYFVVGKDTGPEAICDPI